MSSSTAAASRRVVLYARLSVTTEESVSIERQLDAGRKYADLRGWTVVAEAVDDGVSATKHRPEDRLGWRSVLDHPEPYAAVVVWKVDRLARRVLDFLHADEALRARGAGIVAVEDPIDMTTPQGRAFATMLAVFGEMEAAAISSRVTAARRTIVRSGRRAGGRPPFGYVNVPNTDGPGFVLAQDPERIEIVRTLVRRALDGEAVASLVRWLEGQGIKPRDRAKRLSHFWHAESVETILRNPVLAGMTPYTPGRKPGDDRTDVVRDADGLPVANAALAVISPAQRRELLAALDSRKRPGSRPSSGATPALLYGLARCASCGGLLYRATAGGKYLQYRCQAKDCPRRTGISRPALEQYVAGVVLDSHGDNEVLRVIESTAADTDQAAEVASAIEATLAQMGEDDADEVALAQRLASLKARRRLLGSSSGRTSRRVIHTRRTVREMYDEAPTDEERRAILASKVEAVIVRPGSRAGVPIESRVEIRRLDLLGDEAPTDGERLQAEFPTL